MKFESYKLSELVQIIGGGTPKRKVESYWNGDIPWLSVKDFNDKKRWVHQTDETITEKGLNESSTKLLKTDDLIISARGTVGEIAQLAKPMAFNQSCYGLRAYGLLTTNDYLYYWVRYNVNYVKNNTHGSVFDTITRNTFDNLIVKLPPKEYQNRVVKILSMLDKKIEINNIIILNLEELTQTLFKHWFVDFEFPNEEGKPYKSSGGKMIESELGMIPEGWEVERFEKVINIGSGKRPKSKVDIQDEVNQIPIIGASKVMGYTETELFDESIIVIGRVGTHGVVQRLNIPCWPSDNTFVLRSKYEEFMYHKLKTIDYKSMNRGSTQPLLTQKDIKNVKVILPNNTLLIDFEDTQKKFSSKIGQLKEENTKLEELCDTLLPKLLSGEIELPDDMEVTDDVPIS